MDLSYRGGKNLVWENFCPEKFRRGKIPPQSLKVMGKIAPPFSRLPSPGLAEHQLTAPKRSSPKNVALQAVKAEVQVQGGRLHPGTGLQLPLPNSDLQRTQCQLTLRSLLTGNYMW